jgi:hypothetical protein
MGRLRRDKVPSTLAPSRPRTEPKPKATKSQKKSLKEQVIELGGDEDDYNLVKDFGDHNSESGPSVEDVRPSSLLLYPSTERFCVH